jgi:Domain of unknown function (DUF2382)
MPALDPETRERWRDLVVVDRESATVGTITAFFLDQASGLPTWALVHTGWLADRQIFVPLAEAVEVDREIRLPYTKHQVTDAPRIDPTGELTADDELALAAHYHLLDHHGATVESHQDAFGPHRPEGAAGPHQPVGAREPHPAVGTPEPHAAVAGPPAGRVEAGGDGRDRLSTTPSEGTLEPHPPVGGAPTGRVAAGGEEWDRLSTAPTPVAPASPAGAGGGLVVTRSEEEMRVGVRTRLRPVRVRKYVVTEYVTRTIPVRREKVRLEEVPSDQVVEGGADRWQPAGEAGAPELEVVLHREEPVVQLRPVPVERVRLYRELVSDRRTVTAELRKEQVEVDEGPPGP